MSDDDDIIITQAMLSTAPTVRKHIAECRQKKFDRISAKAPSNWSTDEFHFMLRCVGEAYDHMQ